MKKRAYLFAFALSAILMMTACESGDLTSGSGIASDSDIASDVQTEDPTVMDKTELTDSHPIGFGDRLVSVDNVKKYITIADYKEIYLDSSAYAVTDEVVEQEMLDRMEGQRSEVTDSGEGVREGDLATINYVGTSLGITIEMEENYDLIVGKGCMLEGFEDGLIGMKKGETKELDLVVPENRTGSKLDGSKVTYSVTLQSFQRTPEISDAWVAANTEFATVDEYRAQIRAELEEQTDVSSKELLREIGWNTVLTNSEVTEFPEADIQNAIDEYKNLIMRYNNSDEMNLEDFVKSQGVSMEEFESQCRQYAERKVKQNLIIQGIMDEEGIHLDDEACLAIQDQLISDFGFSSLAELLDAYGQTMIDESIGLLRVEDFIVEHAVDEIAVPEGGEAETAETVGAESEEAEIVSAEGTEG